MTAILKSSIHCALSGMLACSAIATAQACGKNHYILDAPVTCDGALVAPLHTARHGHTATLLPDGRVLVVGGNDDNQLTDPLGYGVRSAGPDSVEIYDPAAGTWQKAAPLVQARRWHSATLLRDGRVLVAGGESNHHWVGLPGGNVEVYDPATNSWAPAAPVLHTPAYAHASATLLPDGRVLMAGGGDVNGNFVLSQLYDPLANAWVLADSPGLYRYAHSATALPDGRILLAGGVDDAFSGTSSDLADIYDPALGRFASAPFTSSDRAMHAATALADGRVLLSGGWSSWYPPDGFGEFHTLASAEVFDPAIGGWSPVNELSLKRYAHTQTLLVDGSVLAIGGTASQGAVPNLTYTTLSSIELRLGGTGASVHVGNLVRGRSYHTATRLGDGTVLIVGGVDTDGAATTTVELIGVAP